MTEGKMGRIGWISVFVFVPVLIVCLCASGQAVALSDGRAYEMVSPFYKGGYGAGQIEAVSPDGESVAFFSKGAFSGAPSGPRTIGYVARRDGPGWLTASAMPPSELVPYVGFQDVSATLGLTLALGKPGPNEEAAFQVGTEDEFLLHATNTPDLASNWEVGGMTIMSLVDEPLTAIYEGGSPDLCHLFLNLADNPLLPEANEATNALTQVYEVDRGCDGGAPALRLVGLNNAGRVIRPPCGVDLGIEGYGPVATKSGFNAVADSGKMVFFTTSVDKGKVCSGIHQLFVRLGGMRTLEVSRPLLSSCSEVPCADAATRASASFVGASDDGSRVFFTTAASLVPEDKDSANDLYMATIGCPVGEERCEVAKEEVQSVVQVSHGGEAAEVQGVVRVAPDGSRVYFVASGVLTTEPNGEGRVPVKGADNLYVYDSLAGKVKFIADLCSDSKFSGAVKDLSCPGKLTPGFAERNDGALWDAKGEAQSGGGDGRFLVFSSYGQLVANDTDEAKDIYRYDADTGALDRVSMGEAGSDSNGNNSLFDSTILAGHWGESARWQAEMDNRAVTEDGSRIVFDSAESLSFSATNGLVNVYEWSLQPGDSKGHVSLISSGSGEESVEDAVISADGDNVFFVTSQGLVQGDGDGADDVYDARIGGGFLPLSVGRQQCAGDACQGALTNPAPLLVPGSVSQAPGENVQVKHVGPSLGKKKPVKKKKKVKRDKSKSRSKRKVKGASRARGGRR